MRYAILLLFVIVAGCKGSMSPGPFDNVSDAPTILAFGSISTPTHHESISFLSKDQRTLYFTRSDKDFQTSTLYSCQFENGNWSPPEVMSFSGKYYDAGLTFSPNGEIAFFTSKRPSGIPGISSEWNIWKAQKDEQGLWGIPVMLMDSINSNGQECCITMNENGETYFSSDREGSWDIFKAEFKNGQFSEIVRLSDKVNSSKGEWPGHINNTNDLLLISSIRDQGVGGDDIYLVKKNDTAWSSPHLLDGLVSSPSYEDSPMMSPDGKTFFFSSWKSTDLSQGVSNIYFMTAPENLSKLMP